MRVLCWLFGHKPVAASTFPEPWCRRCGYVWRKTF